jgi:hypothetical protein
MASRGEIYIRSIYCSIVVGPLNPPILGDFELGRIVVSIFWFCIMANLEIDAAYPADPPPNPPILGDFRARAVSKSPRIGGFRGRITVATID